jgi:hypothetical protein
MPVINPKTVPLRSLYEPITDVLPASEIVTDAYSASNQSFDSLASVQWDSGKFNLQGQNWVQQTPGNWAGGAKNDTSARASGGVQFNMSTLFAFVNTGDKLEIMVISTGAFDMQVYVEYQGKLVKLRDKPLSSALTGYVFRQIKFAATPNGAGGAVSRGGFKRRAYYVKLGGNVNFLQLNVEAASLTYPTPLRNMFVIGPCDSYMEPLHNQNASSDETYFSYGPQDALFEATGMPPWNAAEGGTGFFQNGDGVARTDDTPSSVNGTRWGSAARKTKIGAGFTAGAANPYVGISKPLFMLGHGSINDGALSGGTAPMKARAKVVYAEGMALDSTGLMSMIQVGPEPYTTVGASPPGYQSGSVHDLNRLGQIAAISETPRAYFVDASNPTNPWWTGNGANNSNLADQQALLTGADNIHGNYRGYHAHGRRIADAIGDIPIPIARATRSA